MPKTHPNLVGVLVLVMASIPFTSSACEPIVPLVQLLAGTTLAGPALFKQSLLWLAVAVTLKCGTFIYLERRISWLKAALFMLCANVVSTVPGVFIAICTGSLSAFFFALPVVFLLGWWVQRRLAFLPPHTNRKWISGGMAMLAFVAFFFVSVVLHAMASNLLEQRSFAAYWMLKFLFVTLVAGTGILISGVLEECVIWRLARKAHGDLTFFAPVFRANYLTLAAILLVAALEMLPKRLHAPNFIVSWLTG